MGDFEKVSNNMHIAQWVKIEANRHVFYVENAIYSVLNNESFLQTLESQKQSIEADYKKGYQITEHKAILGGTLESLLSDKPSYKASTMGYTKKFA